MSSSPSAKQWVVIILVNILVSSLTAYFVFRTLVTGAQLGEAPSVAASGAIPADTSPADADATPTSPPSSPVPPPETAPPVSAATAPTATTAPTAAPAAVVTDTAQSASATPLEPAPPRVRISAVLFPGQLTREVAVLVNEGDPVDLSGWVLSSSSGNAYTFGTVTLFKDSFINLRSTTGADVPTDLYWNRSEPAWKAGDTLALSRGGETLTTFSIPAR